VAQHLEVAEHLVDQRCWHRTASDVVDPSYGLVRGLGLLHDLGQLVAGHDRAPAVSTSPVRARRSCSELGRGAGALLDCWC